MALIDLKENFTHILQTFETKGMKRTNIAKQIGYTTTTQLNSTLDGNSLLSTKAVIGLIENLHVNPYYLFLGKGEMFMGEETELDKLRIEKSEWERKFFSMQDELFKCKAELERAVHRYNKLIDITSIAIDKTQKKDEKEGDTDKE